MLFMVIEHFRSQDAKAVYRHSPHVNERRKPAAIASSSEQNQR